MQIEPLNRCTDEISTPSYSRGVDEAHDSINLISPERNILIFELGYTGHYPSYIKHLAKYWIEQAYSGNLTIVVSPKFAQLHPDVLEIASDSLGKNLRFIVITSHEESNLIPRCSPLNRARRALQEWHLVHKYATELEATHCLLLYFDSFQTAISLGKRLPCQFSGIYFRPTFHYPTLSAYSSTLKERIQRWREQFILSLVMRHPQMQVLFCLDPYVIKGLNRIYKQTTAVYLPDPVYLEMFSEEEVSHFREDLGIEPGRQVFLLFGALYDTRKGIHQLSLALSMLPFELRQKVCLLFVGQTLGNEQTQEDIEVILRCAPVQVIVRDTFVPDEHVSLYFQVTDAVLAIYQKHIGMSGILVLAAAAQKPLLSQSYGLLGELTRSWKLGLAVDSTNPSEIAKGLSQFILEAPEALGDRAKMKSFAEQNSAENFARTIFQHM
ncbi:MAG: glycosyltransferase [Leptolyngbyaceae cyanobacterium bins.302]|nr:glycosyltransferase [Leptolyngbyaceae cyanobacterium bins.302]